MFYGDIRDVRFNVFNGVSMPFQGFHKVYGALKRVKGFQDSQERFRRLYSGFGGLLRLVGEFHEGFMEVPEMLRFGA